MTSSTAGPANARIRRYEREASRSSPRAPIAVAIGTANAWRMPTATMPASTATTSAWTITRPAASRSPRPTARATIGVVPYARKLNTTNAIEKIAVFTPSAARGSTPRRPTNTVSTIDTSGSAARAPSAGSASPRISRSKPRRVGETALDVTATKMLGPASWRNAPGGARSRGRCPAIPNRASAAGDPICTHGDRDTPRIEDLAGCATA